MTVEDLKAELEKLVSGLTASGFGSVDSGTVEKLDKLSACAGELGFKEGKKLIENLSSALRSIKDGKSQPESGNIRLTALEFYFKKLSSGDNTEDL